jgi:hypothetical protein
LDLTVYVENVLNSSLIADLCVQRDQPVLICDRCDDADEPVVATMQIFETTFALCGPCARELPTGFHVA